MVRLPEDFKIRMKDMLGEEYDDFIKSYDDESVHGLRINPLKYIPGTLDIFNLEQVPWCKTGFYYMPDSKPGKHPYHEAGVYYIQEPSAMITGELAAVMPGEKVLDLCAAPGGKSTHLAGAMNGQGLLWSNEIHPARARILSQNIERLGITNCVVSNETPERLADRLGGFFDKVIVDAPCSGEGMFRKNPEACGEWSRGNVELCAVRQQDILDETDRMLKYGGKLIYSTCTFSKEENESTIELFIQKHPYYHLETMHRIWPHKSKGEGHFAAVLVKGVTEDADKLREKADGRKTKKQKIAVPDKQGNLKLADELFKKFSDEFLKKKFEGRHILFGDNLYEVPEGMPDISQLKILRPGLQLGTVKKNRLEPSHALALALKPDEVKNYVDIPCRKAAVYSYLRGESLETDSQNGWVLVCTDGYSIGFGKVSAGMIKNHYPKGLRWT